MELSLIDNYELPAAFKKKPEASDPFDQLDSFVGVVEDAEQQGVFSTLPAMRIGSVRRRSVGFEKKLCLDMAPLARISRRGVRYGQSEAKALEKETQERNRTA